MIKYILITPARNEEAYIEKTIKSVIAQTIKPVRWIIVNDGSTDRTGEIARQYAAEYDFIKLIEVSGDSQRNFGSKSKAIQYAYNQHQDADFEYVGNLDADISFEPTYYESIINKMEENPKLGLSGGIRYDILPNGKFKLMVCSPNSVGGPIQLFRRACFDDIGGYKVLPWGGIDAVAEASARMHGWEVRSFDKYRVHHHRPTGTANRSILNASFRAGIRDYTIGYHPLFELMRCMERLQRHPLAAFTTLIGYTWAIFRRVERSVEKEQVAFLQKEQLGRLSKFVGL